MRISLKMCTPVVAGWINAIDRLRTAIQKALRLGALVDVAY
jgi:hypothetical protein